MDDALDVIGSLVIEDGRQWADAATPVQVEAMNAWENDERPYHFDTRSRGFSKTADAAAWMLGRVITDPTTRGFWLAADQEQGQLAIESIQGYCDRTPGLASRIKITAKKVMDVNGGTLEIMAADAPGAWGRRPTLLVVDELAHGDVELYATLADDEHGHDQDAGGADGRHHDGRQPAPLRLQGARARPPLGFVAHG